MDPQVIPIYHVLLASQIWQNGFQRWLLQDYPVQHLVPSTFSYNMYKWICKYLDNKPIYLPFRPYESYATIIYQCVSNNIDASYLSSPMSSLVQYIFHVKSLTSHIYHTNTNNPMSHIIPIFICSTPINHSINNSIFHLFIITHYNTQ